MTLLTSAAFVVVAAAVKINSLSLPLAALILIRSLDKTSLDVCSAVYAYVCVFRLSLCSY